MHGCMGWYIVHSYTVLSAPPSPSIHQVLRENRQLQAKLERLEGIFDDVGSPGPSPAIGRTLADLRLAEEHGQHSPHYRAP